MSKQNKNKLIDRRDCGYQREGGREEGQMGKGDQLCGDA